MRLISSLPKPGFRAIALLLVILYLGFFAGYEKQDILASSISASLLLVLVVAFMLNAVQRRVNKNSGSPVLWLNYPSGETAYSQKECFIGIRFPLFGVLPLVKAIVKLKWKVEPGQTQAHVVSSLKKQELVLSQDVVFPHRGDWKVEGVIVEYKDAFGLFSSRTDIGLDTSFRIHPELVVSPDWPVLASEQREGSDIPSSFKRAGDYLDLKNYEPSDGVRRILWKKFAKNRDLVSRQPELSISVDGKSYLFSLATQADDPLASATVEYAKALEEYGIEVIFGCLGSPKAENSARTEDKLIEGVFDVGHFSSWAQQFGIYSQTIHATANIIITVSHSMLESDTKGEKMQSIANILSECGHTPHFLILTAGRHVAKSEISTDRFFSSAREYGWEVSF